MGKRLEQFIDIHKGETAWVFGKGPSLDEFDFRNAGKLRIGINDLVGTVPDCVYGFCNDKPTPWQDLYTDKHTLFIPKRTAEQCETLPGCGVVVFDDHPGGNDLLRRDKREMCKDLQIREGTLGSAVQVLHIMGVTSIVAVGIDGGGKHARRTQWRTALVNEHFKQYNAIRHSFVQACEVMGIELKFFKKEGLEMKDGYKTVCFNANTFVRGIPYTEGSVVQLQEKDAIDVINAGRGYFTTQKVETPELETASVEKTLETPEKKPIKRTRKRTKK